jgi:hypothetical protein
MKTSLFCVYDQNIFFPVVVVFYLKISFSFEIERIYFRVTLFMVRLGLRFRREKERERKRKRKKKCDFKPIRTNHIFGGFFFFFLKYNLKT